MTRDTQEIEKKSSAEPQDQWVRLQSIDGFCYLVKRKVANASGTIRNMLDSDAGGYAEAISRQCEINERGIIVEKMVEYMGFKTYYETANPKEDVPVKEFLERIPPEIVLELLLAADYQEM
ncbi:POZ domain-containing protein [Pholiota conissans]|uniref:Elongin-C n=1 Tax=Pholiota conissans TaxID=109636 RepID=A0A9P5YX87_9AGAR|nr:POZ domain-containing protein [Pholiota conissans]